MDAVETCAWQFQIEAVSLSCVGHDAGTPTQGEAGRCRLPRATVCHLCVREVLHFYPGASRPWICGRCQRLDRALGRAFGASSMTPHDGQASWSWSSLLGRLFPDRVPREVEEVVTRADGSTATARLLIKPERHPLELLRDHAVALGLAMVQAAIEVDGGPATLRETQPRGEGGEGGERGDGEEGGGRGDGEERGGHVVRWEEWARCFPASDEASARAYQRYTTQVHPWIETVEPRVADLEWLVGVLGAAGPRSAPG